MIKPSTTGFFTFDKIQKHSVITGRATRGEGTRFNETIRTSDRLKSDNAISATTTAGAFGPRRYTQEDLGKAVGCTRQTIIALEQGKYVPSIELAFKIARTFNVNLEDVFVYRG
jgi:putative transcriptional regulator